MTNLEILDKLYTGEISFKKALALLEEEKKTQKGYKNKPEKIEKGHFIKIKIKDEKHSFPIVVPLFLINVGFSLTKIVAKAIPGDKHKEKMKEIDVVLSKISSSDMRKLVNALKCCKPYPLVQVEDGKSLVDIRIV